MNNPPSIFTPQMRPGLKLMLIGPVNIVRGGVLFLTDENIDVLGGDVESMGSNGDVGPLVARLASRLNLRTDELSKRFPNWDRRSNNNNQNNVSNDNSVLNDVSNHPPSVGSGGPRPQAPMGPGGPIGGGGGSSGSSAGVKNVKTEPVIKRETQTKSRDDSSRPTSSTATKPSEIKREQPSTSAAARQQQQPTMKRDPFPPPSSPAPSTSRQRSNPSVSSATPPTPTQHRAVLNELFGASQSFSSAPSDDMLDDFDDDDDFGADDDLFEKVEAIEQKAATDEAASQQPSKQLPRTSPQIETTLNFHPNTQQVVSTSVKLQNFSGELDISHTGGIKVSTSPRSSPEKLQATAKSSRGMAIAAAAVNAKPTSIKYDSSSVKRGGSVTSSASTATASDSSPSTSSSRPWTPNQPPQSFQHDPIYQDDEESMNLSQLKNRSPLQVYGPFLHMLFWALQA